MMMSLSRLLSAVWQVKRKDAVMGLQQRRVHRHVGRRACMNLAGGAQGRHALTATHHGVSRAHIAGHSHIPDRVWTLTPHSSGSRPKTSRARD